MVGRLAKASVCLLRFFFYLLPTLFCVFLLGQVPGPAGEGTGGNRRLVPSLGWSPGSGQWDGQRGTGHVGAEERILTVVAGRQSRPANAALFLPATPPGLPQAGGCDGVSGRQVAPAPVKAAASSRSQ